MVGQHTSYSSTRGLKWHKSYRCHRPCHTPPESGCWMASTTLPNSRTVCPLNDVLNSHHSHQVLLRFTGHKSNRRSTHTQTTASLIPFRQLKAMAMVKNGLLSRERADRLLNNILLSNVLLPFKPRLCPSRSGTRRTTQPKVDQASRCLLLLLRPTSCTNRYPHALSYLLRISLRRLCKRQTT